MNSVDVQNKAAVIAYVNKTVSKLTADIMSRQGNVNIGDDLDVFVKVLQMYEKYQFTKELDKDTFRRAYYWIATHYFILKDFNQSANFYTQALRYVVANKDQQIDIQKLLETVKKNQWPKEAENNAPSYYITFNLACSYSRIDRYSVAFDWLRLALRINPGLSAILKTDKDIELLREQKDKFEKIIKEEM
jgi:tetratricopeptide (TPR) repeat protein